MTDQPSAPSIDALRECVRFDGLRKVASFKEVTQALAAYDALQREVESLRGERDRLQIQVLAANLIDSRLAGKLESYASALRKARSALDVFVSGATKIDLRQAHDALTAIKECGL